jgi:hypothetical protein
MGLEKLLTDKETKETILKFIQQSGLKAHKRNGTFDRYIIPANTGFYAAYHRPEFYESPSMDPKEYIILFVPYADERYEREGNTIIGPIKNKATFLS